MNARERSPAPPTPQPYPVGGGNADDELDGVLHVEAAVPPPPPAWPLAVRWAARWPGCSG